MAVLGHHWEDSTHVSFGVLTAGILTPMAKLDFSWFNCREPDENRYNLDLRVPDSFSVRMSGVPVGSAGENIAEGSKTWAETIQRWQASAGHNENLLLPDATHIGAAVAYSEQTHEAFRALVDGYTTVDIATRVATGSVIPARAGMTLPGTAVRRRSSPSR